MWVNSFDLCGKNCTSGWARQQFLQARLDELTEQQNMVCFNHASAFYKNKNIVKILMNNKFRVQILTGNPTRNWRCHVLASRALNMSCSLGQSAPFWNFRCIYGTFMLIFMVLKLRTESCHADCIVINGGVDNVILTDSSVVAGNLVGMMAAFGSQCRYFLCKI